MQYSKMLPIVTGIIFILTLAGAVYFNGMDSAVFISAIGVSGGIFGSSIIFYLKKAQIENTYKIKISLFKEGISQKIKYTEEILKLRAKYEVDKDTTDEITSELGDFCDGDLDAVKSDVENDISDASNPIELQNYT